MKLLSTLVAATILFLNFNLQGQTTKEKQNGLSNVKANFIQQQGYLSKNTIKQDNSMYSDSLLGFDEAAVKINLLNKGLGGSEYLGHLNYLKRKYITNKFGIKNQAATNSSTSIYKPIGGGNSINIAPCVNEGFEMSSPGAYSTGTAVSGWTVSSRSSDGTCLPTSWFSGSSEFALVSTPLLNVSTLGILPNSPLGGTVVAQLNNFISNYQTTKLAQTFPVTSANSLFRFAYAGVWQDGDHACCEQPTFNVYVRDCSGTLLTCSSLTLNPYTTGCPSGVTNYSTTYSTNNTELWTNWRVESIDLTPFIGSCITIEAICSDCAYGGHYGTTFFDAVCGSQFAPTLNSSFGTSLGGQVNMCAGSSYATIQAPVGYSTYSWVAPTSSSNLTAAQASLSALSLTNAIVGSTYSVYLSSFSGCQFMATYTLAYSTVGIAGIVAAPTCSLGTSGSATVIGSGSGSGYIYNWTNATSSVISTASMVSNLSSGIYSVVVSAIGSPTCGSSSSTINISVEALAPTYVSQQYCGSQAYLSAPTGTNYQWYNGLTAISSTLGGTASSYTVSQVTTTNTVYWLTFITQGCKDSVSYNLWIGPSGSVSATSLLSVCNYTANNGTAVITLTAAPGAPTGQNSFLVLATGSTPSYSSYGGPTSATNYTAANLGNGTYLVSIFDGLCTYGAGFSVLVNPSSNFTLTPSSSQTVCSGNSMALSIVLPSSGTASQYSYSWSPGNFVNSTTSQQTYITPTVAPGTYSTLVYTAQVIPNAINCPETQTLSITVVNLQPPVINPIPQLCTNSSTFMITGIPAGGTFTNNSLLSSTGVLYPSLFPIGSNTFVYAVSMGTCAAASTGNFNIGLPPILNISGNTSFCKGQSTTLLAAGASSYTWNNVFNSPYISVSPIVTTNYTVTGFSSVNSCTNSAIVTVTVMQLPTPSITGPATLCAGETATLSASGASYYLWDNGANTQTIAVSPTTSSTFTVQGANASNECFGTGIISIFVSICADTNTTTTPDFTGLDNLSLEKGLNVYPNPGNGKFVIESTQKIEINLYDAVGKVILQDKIQKGNYMIDLSNYASGVYVLKVTNGIESKIIKLVKNN